MDEKPKMALDSAKLQSDDYIKNNTIQFQTHQTKVLENSDRNQHSQILENVKQEDETLSLMRDDIKQLQKEANANVDILHDTEVASDGLDYTDAEKSLLVQQFDPFDKVLLTKGMDNQILTSFRTLEKSNNMISNTFKVIHQRFLAKQMNKATKLRVPRSKLLYPISQDFLQNYAQELLLDQELQGMSPQERQQLVENLQRLRLIDEKKSTDIDRVSIGNSVFVPANGQSISLPMQSMISSELNNLHQTDTQEDLIKPDSHEGKKIIDLKINQIPIITQNSNEQMINSQRSKTSHGGADEKKDKAKKMETTVDSKSPMNKTMSKIKKSQQQKKRFPLSKYDITTGQVVRIGNEEDKNSSSQPQQSLLALTNEATKAALGHQFTQYNDEGIASWRMNVQNLENNNSSKFNESFQNKDKNSRQHSPSKIITKKRAYDVSNKLMKDSQIEVNYNEQINKSKELNNLITQNESLIGTSMVPTPSHQIAEHKQIYLSNVDQNLSNLKTNKIQLDGLQERSSQRNSQNVETQMQDGIMTRSFNLQTKTGEFNHNPFDEKDPTNDTQQGKNSHINSQNVLPKEDYGDKIDTKRDTQMKQSVDTQKQENSKDSYGQQNSKSPFETKKSTMLSTAYQNNHMHNAEIFNIIKVVPQNQVRNQHIKDMERNNQNQTFNLSSQRGDTKTLGYNPSAKEILNESQKKQFIESHVKSSINSHLLNDEQNTNLKMRSKYDDQNYTSADNSILHKIAYEESVHHSPHKQYKNKFTGGFANQQKLRSMINSSNMSEVPTERDLQRKRRSSLLNESKLESHQITSDIIQNVWSSSKHMSEIQQVLMIITQQQDLKQNIANPQAVQQQHEAPYGQSPIGENRIQIRKIIDDIYVKENKYAKKNVDRHQMVNSNDLIFDLSRAANLNKQADLEFFQNQDNQDTDNINIENKALSKPGTKSRVRFINKPSESKITKDVKIIQQNINISMNNNANTQTPYRSSSRNLSVERKTRGTYIQQQTKQ